MGSKEEEKQYFGKDQLKKKAELPSYIKNRLALVRVVFFSILAISLFFLTQNIRLLRAEENYKQNILSYPLSVGQSVFGLYLDGKKKGEENCIGFLKTNLQQDKTYSLSIEGLIPISPFEGISSSKIDLKASFTDLKNLEKINLKLNDSALEKTANYIQISSLKENTNDYLVKTSENDNINSAEVTTSGMFYLKEDNITEKNSSTQLFFPKEGLNYSKIIKNIIAKNKLRLVKLDNNKNFENLAKTCSPIGKIKHPNIIDNSGLVSLYQKLKAFNS